jgi:hypothetical protein
MRDRNTLPVHRRAVQIETAPAAPIRLHRDDAWRWTPLPHAYRMFSRRRDVSRILLRDDLLPAKAAYDPRRTSARPG